jgi:hypothetical protein
MTGDPRWQLLVDPLANLPPSTHQLRLVISHPWGVDRSELAAIASQKGR